MSYVKPARELVNAVACLLALAWHIRLAASQSELNVTEFCDAQDLRPSVRPLTPFSGSVAFGYSRSRLCDSPRT